MQMASQRSTAQHITAQHSTAQHIIIIMVQPTNQPTNQSINQYKNEYNSKHAKFCHKQRVVPRVSVHPRILRNNHNNKYRQWRPCYRRPHRLTQSASRPSHGRIWFGGNPPGQPGHRMESVIRSIEQGRVEVHRKLPKSESLKQCMDRTIPFFTERIVPEALNQGKRVLI